MIASPSSLTFQSPNMEVAMTSKGGDLLLFQGYSYTRKKTSIGYIRWQCTSQREEGCRGSLTTDDTPIGNPRSFKLHNHPASDARVDAMRCRSELRGTARNNRFTGTAPMLAQALQNLSPEARLAMGTVETVKRDIQRQKAKSRPPEPANRAALNIPPAWTTTGGQHGVRFLVSDTGANDPERMLIFATDECLRHLSNANVWYMDGNFKLCPSIFMQLYVIRTKLDDGAVSCVYAFLSGKAAPNYTALLAAIIHKCHNLGLFPAPTSVVTDFEQAMFNSIRNVFGRLRVNIDACFYHLTQSTWRKIQSLGLANLYNGDDSVKVFVGMMDGLAFLPLNDIAQGVALLQQIIPYPALQPLLAYFLDTYVLGPVNVVNGVQQRGQPLFPPPLWNVHNVTINGGSRTNNICEGWNNGFRSLVGQAHPPFFKCLEALQRDNAIASTNMVQSLTGTPFRTPVKLSYRRNQRNLQRLCQRYQQGHYVHDIQRFLVAISWNIRFDR